MRKKSICMKTAALLTAAAVGITAAGCGAKEQTAGNGNTKEPGTAAGTDTTDESATQEDFYFSDVFQSKNRCTNKTCKEKKSKDCCMTHIMIK